MKRRGENDRMASTAETLAPCAAAPARHHDDAARTGGSEMRKLAALQILRGFAASLVVIDHAVLRHAEWAEYPAFVKVAAPYCGTLGVSVFFVISGFIMFHTAGQQFGEAGAAWAFLRKRIIRIVPLYWAATGLEVALLLRKGGTFGIKDLLASLLFIPLPVPAGHYMYPLLGVGWTLNYEMFFYCLFAAALLFSRPVGLPLLLLAFSALVAFGAIDKPLADTSPPHTAFAFWTDPIILLFAAGVLCGLLAETARVRVFGSSVWIAIALLCGWAAAFVGAGGSYPIPSAWLLAGWVVCLASVALCIFEKPGHAGPARRLGVELGDISYALYLFHFFAIVAAEKVWWLLFGKSPSVFFVAFAYLVAVAAAYAIHHLFEVRVTRLLNSRALLPQPRRALMRATPRQASPPPPKPAHLHGRE